MKGPVKAKKSLGQHFLTDTAVAERIASTMDDFRQYPLLEIGPGTGMLTQFLVKDHDLTVVELDRESVEYLKKEFPSLDSHIIEADFLKLNLSELFGKEEPFCIIGNYPYNISSQIFFKVLEYKDRVKCCSGMLQREVAERLAAPEGTKARGILSVLLQAWYDVSYLFTVDEHVFNPPPKVKSGVVKLVRNACTDLGCDEKLFKTVVKTAFGQRRKTLRNSLRSLLAVDADPSSLPFASLRPEQLSVEQFIALTNAVDKLRS